MTQIQFSLIKNNKDWTSRTISYPPPLLPPPYSLRPITLHFCLTPHPPQNGRHMCITLKQKSFIFLLVEFDAG